MEAVLYLGDVKENKQRGGMTEWPNKWRERELDEIQEKGEAFLQWGQRDNKEIKNNACEKRRGEGGEEWECWSRE